ncbi:MAG: hypothetical protein HEQ32_04975 [Vampirovibrio sp.]
MTQLLYLLTSVVPLLVMYSIYLFVKFLASSDYTKVQGWEFAINSTIHSKQIIILLSLSAIVAVMGLVYVLYKSKAKQKENFSYDSVGNLNSEAMNFFLALALCLSTSNELNYPWVLTLIIFVSILSLRLNDFKVNLLLWFLGWRQYSVSHNNGLEHTLITRRPLKNQSGEVKTVRLAHTLLLEVR